MSSAEVRITEQTGDFDYCRLWDNSVSAYLDYDTEMASRAGTPKLLLGQTADYLYIGADAKFYSFGAYLYTMGDYGALDWEQWDGAAWQSFTPTHDGTSGLSANGYISMQVFGSWGLTTIDGQEAYWIRVSAASVTTVAAAYSLLRNVTLSPPVKLRPEKETAQYYRDVAGTLRKADVAYTGPTKLTITCHQTALLMAGINLMRFFEQNLSKLYIEDLAQTATPDPDTDAYYKEYEGFITECAPGVASPSKMEPSTYELVFAIDAVTEIL